MGSYQGMRWFRCDLQVQTPEDGRHWHPDDPLRLPSPRTEADLQEKARAYLRRCHEVGLEVIGVTDHNFCAHRNERERFLGHLIEQNQTVASEMSREPLAIFPGFEIDIGFHVLCLFPPVPKGSRLDVICDVLTKLGLSPDRRFTGDGLEPLRRGGNYVPLSELLRTVQEEHGGIVIAAHAFEEDGIAQDAKWAGDFRNEDLLCVEVSRMPLGEREKAVLDADHGVWKRTRPVAFIRSSDAKSTLLDDDGKPRPNSLGYRSTWIKMSEPSIEALRQAFLDPPSRIHLDPETDPRLVRHDRIASLAVRDVAFVADQEVVFSPHLNCLIGGRGSGKSSLFEYIRLALRLEDDPAAREQVDRIRKTLRPDSVLTLRWQEQDAPHGARGLEDVFEYEPARARSQVVSREVADSSTVFRGLNVHMFSQRQITGVARESGFLLDLIDEIVGAPLVELQQEESALREQIALLQQKRQTLGRLRAEESAIAQEVMELDRRWATRSALLEEQQRFRTAQEARGYLAEVAEHGERTARELEKWAGELVESHAPLGSVARGWPEPDFFVALDQALEEEKQRLAEAIRQVAASHRQRIAAQTAGSGAWPALQETFRRAEEDFQAACARQGLRPEDLAQLAELEAQRKAKSLRLAACRNQIAALDQEIGDPAESWSRLYRLWRRQTEARRNEIARVLGSPAIPRRDGNQPILEVPIHSQGDRHDFLDSWTKVAPNGRTRLGRQWQEVGEQAIADFAGSDDLGSPWQVVQDWLEERRPFPFPDLLGVLDEHLRGADRERWERTRLHRVRDSVDLILYRPDGTLAGSLVAKELSEGQTNTAVLLLLLASGKGPILIDQPEDELDSSFISDELVPLLRAVKNERQIIVVTHNPNLPVNADAELVYALEARKVGDRARGVVRAEGGLDRDSVKLAVLDILEGSEEAFRKRREKYRF
jgi:AAA domain